MYTRILIIIKLILFKYILLKYSLSYLFTINYIYIYKLMVNEITLIQFYY